MKTISDPQLDLKFLPPEHHRMQAYKQVLWRSSPLKDFIQQACLRQGWSSTQSLFECYERWQRSWDRSSSWEGHRPKRLAKDGFAKELKRLGFIPWRPNGKVRRGWAGICPRVVSTSRVASAPPEPQEPQEHDYKQEVETLRRQMAEAEYAMKEGTKALEAAHLLITQLNAELRRK